MQSLEFSSKLTWQMTADWLKSFIIDWKFIIIFLTTLDFVNFGGAYFWELKLIFRTPLSLRSI